MEKTMELTREQILEADDLQIKAVDVPEWGGVTYVRTINAEDYAKYVRSNVDANGKATMDNYIARYCAFTICDSKGNRLFTDNDAIALGKKYSSVMARLYNEAQTLNGEDIEELEKNSETAQSEDSASG